MHYNRHVKVLLASIALLFACEVRLDARAGDNDKVWDAVDKAVKPNIYQVNVAIHAKLKDGMFAQLADLSPRRRYPVFATQKTDQGFRVVGHGTCFPIRTAKQDRTYLLTNKHVIDFGPGMIQECQRFFAGMRLYAERSSGFASPDQRYQDLLRIVNLCTKKDLTATDRQLYAATVDTIWDTYDDHLSIRVDPSRKEFNKYVAKTGIQGSIGFFVHSPGSVKQPPMVAQLYREAQSDRDPDLAILSIRKCSTALDLEPALPKPGELVQSGGYPINAKPTKGGPAVPYEPSFITGKVVRVSGQIIHFDASVSKGDSGGPLLSTRGKVYGVVARRAISTDRYAGAISSLTVRSFAPELFK